MSAEQDKENISTAGTANAPEEKKSVLKNKWVQSSGLVVLALVIAAGVLYLQMSNSRVGIDTSIINAPSIVLSPNASGVLQQVYVHEGDEVAANTPVALVGTELIKTKIAGIITSIQNNAGTIVNPTQMVVTMIDPNQMRVVGTIDENKGLNRIRVGQEAFFSVDAYGSKNYQGIVDEISPSSNQSGVVFNISDQRETQQFNIKVRFDPTQYPELKNGMSAKLTIFTK
ncbi:MAG: HlyD family efflux transporter periplasmic adaptor subunit [Candidatus Doudnabacteria bacterium]